MDTIKKLTAEKFFLKNKDNEVQSKLEERLNKVTERISIVCPSCNGTSIKFAGFNHVKCDCNGGKVLKQPWKNLFKRIREDGK